jgi:ElaB/YqjD/DUF883 family membrane-anchored ribosome-binding protein
MPNLSYCRFQNTADDLADCRDHIDDEHLSAKEDRARTRLITLCREIAALFDDEADDAYEELCDLLEARGEALERAQERIESLEAQLAAVNKGE